jgi:serine/threonine protein phosphatase 1
MNNLPYYYETEHHLFVHAGIPQRQMNLPPKNAHRYEEMIWMIYDKTEPGWWKEKHVVHGHHQFADGPHEWSGRTDLDTHAWRTGRLVIGVFSSEVPGKAIRYLEVKGDNYGS